MLQFHGCRRVASTLIFDWYCTGNWSCSAIMVMSRSIKKMTPSSSGTSQDSKFIPSKYTHSILGIWLCLGTPCNHLGLSKNGVHKKAPVWFPLNGFFRLFPYIWQIEYQIVGEWISSYPMQMAGFIASRGQTNTVNNFFLLYSQSSS